MENAADGRLRRVGVHGPRVVVGREAVLAANRARRGQADDAAARVDDERAGVQNGARAANERQRAVLEELGASRRREASDASRVGGAHEDRHRGIRVGDDAVVDGARGRSSGKGDLRVVFAGLENREPHSI